ncbi:MAG TPA: hypothetical protein EYP55_07200 [Anaerolineae bacterium]|nr:hypothetical protein [Anaerolineae bacterium]
MKLIAAIVQDEDADGLLDALMETGFRATKIQTTGGFLRGSSNLILVGVEPEKVDQALEVIRTHCQARTQLVYPDDAPYLASPLEVRIGGAIVFVWELERYERL